MGVETRRIHRLLVIVVVLIFAPSLASADDVYNSLRHHLSTPEKQDHDFILRYEEENEQQQDENYPYVFQGKHFFPGLQSEHGRVLLHQKFSDRSELLRSIETYQILILEAQPQAFFTPHHVDAEALLFVTHGTGTISKLWQNRRERFNVREGDILRIEAGVTMYAINRDKYESLVVVMLTQSVFGSKIMKTFFAPGGRNPESYYNAFSAGILEAFFKTKIGTLKKLFGNEMQGGGAFVKATEEQIEGLSRRERGGASEGYSFNIFRHGVVASKSNEYGQLYEVDANAFDPLRDLDVAISFSNITKGSMEGPFYSSKATRILVVVGGEGYMEMSCPYMDRSTRILSYKKLSAILCRHTTVVIPTGYPLVALASPHQNLQFLCFEINARHSSKFSLAGNVNIWNQLEKEAKELSFGVSAQEVDEVLQNQDETSFFKGPSL